MPTSYRMCAAIRTRLGLPRTRRAHHLAPASRASLPMRCHALPQVGRCACDATGIASPRAAGIGDAAPRLTCDVCNYGWHACACGQVPGAHAHSRSAVRASATEYLTCTGGDAGHYYRYRVHPSRRRCSGRASVHRSCSATLSQCSRPHKGAWLLLLAASPGCVCGNNARCAQGAPTARERACAWYTRQISRVCGRDVRRETESLQRRVSRYSNR